MKRGLLVVLLLVACKDKPNPPPAKPEVVTAGSAGSAKKPPPQGKSVELPKGTGKPPIKTKKRLPLATWQKLSKLTYADWENNVPQVGDNQVEIKYRTKVRPKISVTVTGSHCLDCVPMKLASWQPKLDALRQLWIPAPTLRARKDTVFELGETALNGQPVIYSYQLGSNVAPDPDNENQPSGEYTDAYVLYYNDGNNQVIVAAAYADDTLADIKALTEVAPKEDLEQIAKAFLDAFTQAW